MSRPQVRIDPDIRPLIPRYLDNRRKDIQLLEQAVAVPDFEKLKKLGHDLKGCGDSYGFLVITEAGRKIEAGAHDRDQKKVLDVLAELINYLDSVEIIYEP